MEDCLLIAGNLEIDQDHLEQFPALVHLIKQLLENELNDLKVNHSQFILSSPKERYLHFLNNCPNLQNRVPLHQVARYLGMTAESLSPIRKRLVSPYYSFSP